MHFTHHILEKLQLSSIILLCKILKQKEFKLDSHNLKLVSTTQNVSNILCFLQK